MKFKKITIFLFILLPAFLFWQAFVTTWNMSTAGSGSDQLRVNVTLGTNPLSYSWNTGAVKNMNSMFDNATAFNQNIGAWNTAAVTNMAAMFYQAKAFNQNIGSWNTAAVTDMGVMFNGATVFNPKYWCVDIKRPSKFSQYA